MNPIDAPNMPEMPETGIGLTFILEGGCNLGCKFCFIDRARERKPKQTAGFFTPESIRRFIQEAIEEENIAAIGIHGDEPLMEHAVPLTKAVLGAGTE